MEIKISKNLIGSIKNKAALLRPEIWILLIAVIFAVSADVFFYLNDQIVAYGDSESHLNIAKRVVDSLTPGFAQLGGIWLPLPHIFLIPFVNFDFLWRSGLAGSIVSGIAFVIASIFVYKTTFLLTQNKSASFLASFIFITNPNILYLQATPMTELTLIVFFVLSSYFFLKFALLKENIINLIYAAFFGFCATLSRYDGWFLVSVELALLAFISIPITNGYFDLKKFKKIEGLMIMFFVLAFFGIALWLLWDALILGDPLYFTHSVFSAKSQQQGWLARGELPSYNNAGLSIAYYFVTAMSNVGVIIWIMALCGLVAYITSEKSFKRLIIALLLGNIFIFNVLTLYIGQSVIFIPHITPPDFDWTLFNVRYGVMMMSFSAIFIGFLFTKLKIAGKLLILGLIIAQFGLYGIGYSKIVSLEDGITGLSSAKRPDAERFIKENYDQGLVLMDDFSRTVSIVRSGIPMENMIYIGNKPYWEESLEAPEKYATWIIIQRNDTLWKTIFEPRKMQDRIYAYFVKVYESPEIIIFKKQGI